jgi:hypothetical protein
VGFNVAVFNPLYVSSSMQNAKSATAIALPVALDAALG